MSKVELSQKYFGNRTNLLSFDDISVQFANKILVNFEGEVSFFLEKAVVGKEISTTPTKLNKQAYTISRPKPLSRNKHRKGVFLNHVKPTAKVDSIIQAMQGKFFVDDSEILKCTKAGLSYVKVGG